MTAVIRVEICKFLPLNGIELHILWVLFYTHPPHLSPNFRNTPEVFENVKNHSLGMVFALKECIHQYFGEHG
jgi:hypothetical protein